jgi:hypothetical protein
MQVHVTVFWLHKPGLRAEEYEDAFYPKFCPERPRDQVRFAVADGATEGVGSAAWAQILVKEFCTSKAHSFDLARYLQRVYKRWGVYRERCLQDLDGKPGGVPWFVEEGLRVGAFSTLLGLTLSRGQDGVEHAWEALAVGDSCLALVRRDELIQVFPIRQALDFGNNPLLIGSNPAYNEQLPEVLKVTDGTCRTDDALYLMTDALAAWFLREYEAHRAPWGVLRDLDTREQEKPFADWIRELQSSGSMRKDDVTLIRIDLL